MRNDLRTQVQVFYQPIVKKGDKLERRKERKAMLELLPAIARASGIMGIHGIGNRQVTVWYQKRIAAGASLEELEADHQWLCLFWQRLERPRPPLSPAEVI
jgi:hypothetical protein